MEFSFKTVTAWFEQGMDYVSDNKKQVGVAVAGIMALAMAYLGYGWYNHRVQTSAHKDFIEALRYYDAPVRAGKTMIGPDHIEFATETEKWQKVAEVFKTAYASNKQAGIAGIFHVYAAEALANQGDVEAAITQLTAAIRVIGSAELKDFYSLKLALMKTDSNNQQTQQAGLAELKKIAETTNHFAHEAGLYYLGLYFWSQKDFAQAKNYWQQLMVRYGSKDTKQQSGFAEDVKTKLKLISADW